MKFNYPLFLILIALIVFWFFIIFIAYETIIFKAEVNLLKADRELKEVKMLKSVKDYKIAMFRERENEKYAVLNKIIMCESGGNRFAKNPKSSALGIFQIINGTRDLCERNLGVKIDRTNVDDSWLCAKWLFNRYGLSSWEQCKNKLGL